MEPEIFDDGGFDFKVGVYAFVLLTELDPFPNKHNGSSSGVGLPRSRTRSAAPARS
jgi:hypothetical protein